MASVHCTKCGFLHVDGGSAAEQIEMSIDTAEEVAKFHIENAHPKDDAAPEYVEVWL